MIHDKTLLFSAESNVKTATLSEPLSAFERFAIVTIPNTYRESTVQSDCNRRIDTIGSWQNNGYMIWPTNVVVGGDTTTLDVNHFQMMMQVGTETGARTFGFGNTANNCNRILEVYGINRKDASSAEGIGSPGAEYTAYNETLLCSGTASDMTGDIQLSDRANTFHRLKVGVGTYGENINIYDVDSPVNWTAWLPLYSYWGTSTGSYYFSEHRYRFSNSATVITPIAGKTHQLGTAAANPYTTTGNYTDTSTYIRHPLYAIWGINKKSPHALTILSSDHGSAQASILTGYEYDQVNITDTPDAGWYFDYIDITGATVNGKTITLQDQDASARVVFTDNPTYTLTLQNDGHGTIAASKTTGHAGDTVTLSNTYNTYYRFNNYTVTGGTINGSTFTFGSQNATAKANFKVNSFTASGGWEKGSNVSTAGRGAYSKNVGPFYATASYKTSNVPAAWYNTSNRWKVTSTVSAYNITLAPKMTFTGKCNIVRTGMTAAATGVSLIGSTQTQSQNWSTNATGQQTWNYSKSFTSNTTSVNYGISGKIAVNGSTASLVSPSAGYIASKTTGTWTATGYIP